MNRGVATVASSMNGEAWELAIGEGTTPPWSDNETLEDEYTREDATTSITTTTLANDTVKFEYIFEFSEIKTISEYGLFLKSTGKMMCRWVEAPITTEVGQRLRVALWIQVRRS